MSNESVEIDESGQFRPNLKPIALAVIANLVFGGVLLGLPYLRGQERAEASVSAFAGFAACLLEAEVAPRPGLSLPRGERARFASVVVRGEAAWPGRCRDALHAVAPEPAIFLFPSVKSAENEVRAQRDRVDRALVALDRDREEGRAPEAVLDAVARLQGMLVEEVRAAGVEVDPSREAIRLGDASDLPTPSIVPLRVAEGGRWAVALDEGALLATATDARAIAHVRVVDGRVDLKLARRPALASAVLGAREPPWVIWSTSAAQCARDDSGCAQRATGLASLTEDRQRLAPFAWLRAHPFAAPEDAVHVRADEVWIAAVADSEHVDVRRFALPQARGAGDAPESTAELTRVLDAAGIDRVRWIDGEPPALAWTGGEGAGLVRATEDAVPIELESPGGAVELASCGSADDGWVVLASERGMRARRADGSGATLVVDARLDPPDRDALRVTCGEALELLVASGGALLRASCDASACAATERVVEEGVARFDVVRLGAATLIAYASATDGPVRVVRLEPGVAPSTTTPAACWEPEDGLCGEPRLATDGAHVALVTRQGSDLRALVSDDGLRWRALVGLEQP